MSYQNRSQGGVIGDDWPGPRHVRVRVPAGYKPDDDLFFNSPSGGCSVVLPHGIKEGDVLQVALPQIEQKIEILNAYFGRDPWAPRPLDPYTDRRNFPLASESLIEYAASELDIKDQIKDITRESRCGLEKKLDKILKTLLDQQSEEEVHFVGTHVLQLHLNRDRSVATGVAKPMQPPPRTMRREIQEPFEGPPTSILNGIYLSLECGCPMIFCVNAVDDRTIERVVCSCLYPGVPCYELYNTNDGILYRTYSDCCFQAHDFVVKNDSPVGGETCCISNIRSW